MRKKYWIMAAIAALAEVFLLGCGARIDQAGLTGDPMEAVIETDDESGCEGALNINAG